MITPCNDVMTSFSAIIIQIHEHGSEPTIRLILVEMANTQAVYERFGTWAQCEILLASLMGCSVAKDKMVGVRKRLKRKRPVIIASVMASQCQLEGIGFPRADRH